MSYLYVDDNGSVVGAAENRITVRHKDGMNQSLPIETLDGISVLGKSQLTFDCVEQCLRHGIPVAYYSKSGKYFGRITSTGHVDAALQRRQAGLYNTDFALKLAANIVRAKIKNQTTVLRRYARNNKIDIHAEEKDMAVSLHKIERVDSISTLMGYEGFAAKAYFRGLAKCIHPDFAFSGRNRRPPKDRFNSMISLGYSILMNEIYGAVEAKGLNPYFGFLHQDAEKHPTLCSDLMEEWRAVIVDATVMSLINGLEISKDEFSFDEETLGCYISKSGLKKFLTKLNQKLETRNKYLEYLDYQVSYRRAILLQAGMLAKAIEEGNAEIYKPIVVR